MARYLESVCKLCRREGEKLYLKGIRCDTPKCAVERRKTAPGMHGMKRGKLSEYGLRLREKQKLKRFYGVLERQFRRYYDEARRRTGDTGEHMVGLLERRLDAVVYRAKFVPTPFSARQLVSHGHVTVNGKRVTISSYLVKEGDVVELKAKAKDMALVLEAVKSTERDVPDYVEADHSKMTAKFLRTPKLSDVPYPVQMQPSLVVEFYSR